MSRYDPRQVAQALDDLLIELGRWSSQAGDTIASAAYVQQQVTESVDRGLHQASIVVNQAHQDALKVRDVSTTVAAAADKGLAAQTTSHETLQQTIALLDLARETLATWEDELRKALAWLARAEARLARAIQELELAQRELSSAEWQLSSAESRYRACMNDKEGRNCAGEAAAVSAARYAVRAAQARVYAAQQEVAAAKQEVEAAKARVACCRRAVGLAQQAVAVSENAHAEAGEAVNAAERSLEMAQSAARACQIAQSRVEVQVEAADSMMAHTRRAQGLNDQAAAQLKAADQLEDDAQRYVSDGRRELEYRVEQLFALNRPTLESGGAGIASGGSSRAAGAALRGSDPSYLEAAQFTDGQSRTIGLRQWSAGNQFQSRAFDAANGSIPDSPTRGIGRADAHLDTYTGHTRVRLNNIEVDPSHRRAGIANRILDRVIGFARAQGATEIYGTIEDAEALRFWQTMTHHGWQIVADGSAYGQARYLL